MKLAFHAYRHRRLSFTYRFDDDNYPRYRIHSDCPPCLSNLESWKRLDLGKSRIMLTRNIIFFLFRLSVCRQISFLNTWYLASFTSSLNISCLTTLTLYLVISDNLTRTITLCFTILPHTRKRTNCNSGLYVNLLDWDNPPCTMHPTFHQARSPGYFKKQVARKNCK